MRAAIESYALSSRSSLKLLNVAFEEFAAKVYQQSMSQAGQFQIRKHLFLVNPREKFERFQLDKHHSCYHKGRSRALGETPSAKLNGN